MKTVLPMQKYRDHETELRDNLILKFSDESFTILDAVEFEVISKEHPEIVDMALTNRKIRHSLESLPKIVARPGFEERLEKRIARTKTAS